MKSMMSNYLNMGACPRPRVAILGTPGIEFLKRMNRNFPTLYIEKNVDSLLALVDPTELDLLIITKGLSKPIHNLPNELSTISFSLVSSGYDGPIPKLEIYYGEPSKTQEFTLPDVPLGFNYLRKHYINEIQGVRGWYPILTRAVRRYPGLCYDEAMKLERKGEIILAENSILMVAATSEPLGIILVRSNKLGLAWLPNSELDQADWVLAIVEHWKELGVKGLEKYPDWRNEWASCDEIRIKDSIEALENERKTTASGFDRQRVDLDAKFLEAQTKADSGIRRLLTEQDTPLVEEIVQQLERIGFKVIQTDEILDEGDRKKEDLILSCKGIPLKEWSAIVEVCGYKRSAGKTEKIIKLARYANDFQTRYGHLPNKRILIINGPIELTPLSRPIPFQGAEDVVSEFALDGGLVISTVELFRTVRNMDDEESKQAIIESIKSSTGIWKY